MCAAAEVSVHAKDVRFLVGSPFSPYSRNAQLIVLGIEFNWVLDTF